MQLYVYLFFFLVVIAIAAYGYWFSEAAKIRRALKEARPVPIGEARAGEVVKLTGQVRPIGPMLLSPLGKQQCVFFETTVSEYRSSGKSGRWVELVRETEGQDFLVDDGTGRALVHGADMKVVLVKDTELRSGTFNDASPELEAFLQRRGLSSKGWVFNKKLRYNEGVFAPGERVTVLGSARWEHDPDPREAGSGYRDVPKRLVLGPRPEGPVLASDEPDLT